MAKHVGRLIRLVVVTGVWLAAVTWYWWNNVTLVPDRVTRLTDRVLGHAETSPGTYSFAGWKYKDPTAKSGLQKTGPLQIVDSKTGRVVRQFLQPDDEIHAVTFHGQELALVSHNGRLSVVNLSDGGTRCSIEEELELKQSHFWADGKVLLLQTSAGLAAYDTSAGQQLWSRPGFSIRSLGVGVPSQLVLVAPVVRPERTVGNTQITARLGPSQVINVQTGEAEDRFGDPTVIYEIQTSPGGKYVAISRRRSTQTIHDASTGQLLWTLPATMPRCRFSDDGERVIASHLLKKGDPWAWNAADGRVIDSPSDAVPGTFANGRYSLRGPSILWIHKLPRVTQWLMKYRLSSVVTWLQQQQHQRFLHDNFTNRTVGRIANHSWIIAEDKDHTGISIETWGYVVHYPLPPRPNWLWLVGWAIGPPVGIVLLRVAWRRYRQQSPDVAYPGADQLTAAS